jgi:oligopeptide transport system ATP-binding protein
MRLQRPGRIVSGKAMFKGQDLTKLTEDEMREIRGREIAMIFQDPMTSLNPVFDVGWQVAEPTRLHHGWDAKRALASAVNMLGRVGIPSPAARAEDYPHQFSGGMRQRVMIAMGLTTTPQVLIADEPTTALDVTIQAQILDLLRHVNREFGTATILITHNLGVVAGMCQRILVMYAGRVVESGPTTDVFAHPKHPYTWSLLRSIPRLDDERHEPLRPIEGFPPNLVDLPSGCVFHPRCAFRIDRCTRDVPALLQVGGTQLAACWVTQAGGELKDA